MPKSSALFGLRGTLLMIISTSLIFAMPLEARGQEGQERAALTPEELFKRVSPSVFVVEALGEDGSPVAFGSGVAVSANEVVTNKHVIEDATSIRIDQNGHYSNASVTAVDSVLDLCWLRVEGINSVSVPVRTSELRVGERVYAIGSPEGLELTISEGLVSGIREMGQGLVIQTTAALSHGSSGGGLFDSEGQLVGITTFSFKEGQNLNFAIPAQFVMARSNPLSANPDDVLTKLPQRASMLVKSGYEEEDWENAQNDYQEAVRLFREVIRMGQQNAQLWSGLGDALLGYNQYKPAEAAYKNAVELDPNFVQAWSGLGNTYFSWAKYDLAAPALEKATALESKCSYLWRRLGDTYSWLARKDEAMRAYRNALGLNPNDAEAYYGLGKTSADSKNDGEAIKYLEEAIRIQPDHFYANALLDRIYLERGNVKKVEEMNQTLKMLTVVDASRRAQNKKIKAQYPVCKQFELIH